MSHDCDRPAYAFAVAASMRRLDALAAEHPELTGPTGADNIAYWITTIETDEENQVPKEETTQLAFRLSNRLIERLDRHATRMGKDQPGVTFNRADAVRALLTYALDEIEEKPAKKGGK